DYQFKVVTSAAYGDDRAGMVRYFGYMSIATGIVALAVQLTITGRLVAHAGVVGTLLVLPVALGAGEVALGLLPGLAAGSALQIADETVRFTVNDAATQLVYLPVPSSARARFKALLDAALKPGAQVAVGALLIVYRAVAGERLGPSIACALVLIVVWTSIVWR